MADIEAAKKHAGIRVAVVLKRIMGNGAEGNLEKDMYTVFKEELPDDGTKEAFKDRY